MCSCYVVKNTVKGSPEGVSAFL
uniref:Uncharacterized protein n=1 Tax=Anguilla anguilla TaxID=7936 RepID=A0A0E9Q0I7_ANGAN